MEDNSTLNPVELATELTVAWLGNPNNRIAADEAPVFLRQMHATILELSGGAPADAHASGNDGEETFTPAVSVRKSLASKDHIISMIDGKPYKTLRRHLSTHGLRSEEHTSELQSLMRISYAVFCLKKKKKKHIIQDN